MSHSLEILNFVMLCANLIQYFTKNYFITPLLRGERIIGPHYKGSVHYSGNS